MRPKRSAYPYRLPSLVGAALLVRMREEESILRGARLFAQDVYIKKARRPPTIDGRRNRSTYAHMARTMRLSLALRSCTSGLGARERLLAILGLGLGLGNVPAPQL